MTSPPKSSAEVQKPKPESYESWVAAAKQQAQQQESQRRERTKQKVEVLHEFNKQKKQQSEMRRDYLSAVLAHPDFQTAVEALKDPLSVVWL